MQQYKLNFITSLIKSSYYPSRKLEEEPEEECEVETA